MKGGPPWPEAQKTWLATASRATTPVTSTASARSSPTTSTRRSSRRSAASRARMPGRGSAGLEAIVPGRARHDHGGLHERKHRGDRA